VIQKYFEIVLDKYRKGPLNISTADTSQKALTVTTQIKGSMKTQKSGE
tara:strand:- start:58 stop:201 length:144 start_codon:yes stop_codon:yes gene_type:complete